MMKKNDYRTEFEEQRQEINMNEDPNNGEIPSRVDLHRKGRKVKRRSGPKLINVLLGLFTLIPVGILIFVVFTWNSPRLEPAEIDDSQFQFETSGKSSGDVIDEEDGKLSKEELAKEEQAKKAAEEEQVRKEQEEQAKKAAEEEQARKAQEEQLKKDEAAAAEKAKEEQAEKEEQPAARTHTVAAGETLYRISVNYYKSGDGVAKIIQANGLTSNEISTGQKLIIP